MTRVVLAMLVSLACSTPPPSSPEPQPTLFPDLTDCTDKGLSELEDSPLLDELAWKRADLDAATSAVVLSKATAWARENCYVPCPFQMCGMVLEGPGGTMIVYIRPLDVDFGDPGIWPEASVVFSRDSWEVVDQVRFHTGCTIWTGECAWKPEG